MSADVDDAPGPGRAPAMSAWLERVSGRLPGGARLRPWIDATEQVLTRLESIALIGKSEVERLTEKVPPLAWAKQQREGFERRVLRELRQRMDRATGAGDTAAPSDPAPSEVTTSVQVLGSLLDAGLRQTAEQAREATLLRAVRELVPDEAKMLIAMVGDEGQAMLHVNVGRQRVLSYVTSAARAANVRSRDMSERYITHLIDLGLVEAGPQDATIPLEYELLEGSTVVRAVIDASSRLGRVRIERGTVRLTELGRALWAGYSGDDTNGSGPPREPQVPQ